MKLIFVRHGQTDYNKRGIMQGQEIDVPLNNMGVEQVAEMAKLLPEHVDRILSSPMKRTAESAEIINKRYNLPIEFRDELKELRYGAFAGKTSGEIAEALGDTEPGKKDSNATFDYRAYGGECGEDLKARLKKCVDGFLATNQNETIVAVAHGGVIAAMHALYNQGHGEGSNAQIHEFNF